jgi:hypothetical protein
LGVLFAAFFFLIFAFQDGVPDAPELFGLAATSAFVGAGLVGLVILANRYSGGAQIRSWMDQYKLEGAVSRFEYDSERLVIKDRLFGGEMDWAEAKSWSENEEVLLIYRNTQFYYFVSKRDVPPHDVNNLIDVMRSANVPKH